MIQGNYDQIIKLIADSSSLPIEEIERKIEARRAKLSGLISKEGAAQIIASELGVSFDRQKMKISGLLSGMKKVIVIGKIIRLNKVIEYNKNGRSGKIGSFLLADDTSNIRVVLWDTNHISLIEKGEVKEGDFIEISGGDVRNSEIHLTGFANLKLSNTSIENIKEKPVVQKKNIENIQMNDNVSLRGFIVQIFGPTFFNVCSQCGKKVSEISECEVHGKVIPRRNAILTLIIDDGSGSIRAVVFSENIKKIAGLENLDSPESFVGKREELLGREIFADGGIRRNKLSENLELFVNDIREVELDKLIEELEANR